MHGDSSSLASLAGSASWLAKKQVLSNVVSTRNPLMLLWTVSERVIDCEENNVLQERAS